RLLHGVQLRDRWPDHAAAVRLYGSGTIGSSDLYNGQTVAGASMGNSYAAAPEVVEIGDQAIVYITTGAAQVDGQCNGSTCDKNELNADPTSRGAWQEIK